MWLGDVTFVCQYRYKSLFKDGHHREKLPLRNLDRLPSTLNRSVFELLFM